MIISDMTSTPLRDPPAQTPSQLERQRISHWLNQSA